MSKTQDIEDELRPTHIMEMVRYYNEHNTHGHIVEVTRDPVAGYLTLKHNNDEITTGVPEIAWRIAGMISAIGFTH